MKKRLVTMLLALVMASTGSLAANASSIGIDNSSRKQIGSQIIDRSAMETKDWNDPDIKLKVRWSGVNFYEFVLPNGKTIVMDPYFDKQAAGGHNEYNYTPTDLPAGEWVNGADYILLTHGHSDHVGDLASVLEKYPGAHVIAPEHVMPAVMWSTKQEYGNHYFHEAAALDKLEFNDFKLETCRSNHNLSKGPQSAGMDTKKYTDANGNLDFYKLYSTIYEREIVNARITLTDGFSILIWNSEMQPDGQGFEDRPWFYKNTKPDLFMFQVAGASFGGDRRNPNCTPMGEWIASVGAAMALPEHQQHFSYDELDSMAKKFSAICNDKKKNTTFLTPESAQWYGFTKDAKGNVKVYKVNVPSK